MNVKPEERKEVFAKCVDIINKGSEGNVQENLLAIAALFADLKFDSQNWITSSIDNSKLSEAKMILELLKEAEGKAEKRGEKRGMLQEAK